MHVLILVHISLFFQSHPSEQLPERKTSESKAGKQRHPLELEVIANIPPKYHCPPVSFEPPSAENCKKQCEIMEAVGNTEGPLYQLLKMRSTQETPKPEPRPLLGEISKPVRPQVCDMYLLLFFSTSQN